MEPRGQCRTKLNFAAGKKHRRRYGISQVLVGYVLQQRREPGRGRRGRRDTAESRPLRRAFKPTFMAGQRGGGGFRNAGKRRFVSGADGPPCVNEQHRVVAQRALFKK